MVSHSSKLVKSEKHQQYMVSLFKEENESKQQVLLHSFPEEEEANIYKGDIDEAIEQGIHGHRELRALRSYNHDSVPFCRKWPSEGENDSRYLSQDMSRNIRFTKPNRRM
jgi:hypothetical protein